MAEWLVEEGIGETRAIRLAGGGTIAAALADWPGALSPGEVADAVLVSRSAGSPRGTVRFPGGEEALADRLPREASEGAVLRMAVTRAALGEQGRHKLAQARPSPATPCPAPTLSQQLRRAGHEVRLFRQFPACDWDELLAEAWGSEVTFAGGQLAISPTPAMTLIDIDGTLPPRALALAAIPALSATILRFGLAGSLGIDFPTLADKGDRRAVDGALAAALGDWLHERTAMNGFGFVQLVSRLERPSLVQRIAANRAGAAARQLLRQGERVADPGALLLTAHPAVLAAIAPDWEAELARRSGRAVRRQADPALALAAGFAQAVRL